MTPRSLAVWFMDDGSVKFDLEGKPRHIILSTNGFSFEEQEIIVKFFKEKYGIDFKIVKESRTFRIELCRADGCDKFIDLVKPFIIDSMSYKIDRSKNSAKPYVDKLITAEDMICSLQECKELIRNYQSLSINYCKTSWGDVLAKAA